MKEKWRFIPGYGRRYKVSSLGRVSSEKRKVYYGDHRNYRVEPRKIKKQSAHHRKYFRVTLTNEQGKATQITVHRLMAWAFIGKQEKGVEVRHINGDCLDNRIENLCYGTKSDNMRDAIEHRTFSMSDWHPRAKLTKEQVQYIRTCGRNYRDLAFELDIHPNTIHKIRRYGVRNHDST